MSTSRPKGRPVIISISSVHPIRIPGVIRPINLDPGYIEESKIVLASTKNFYHRIFLGDGIYAEVTMHYEAGRWGTFPCTFPDFRGGHYDGFLSDARRICREQLKPNSTAH